MTLLTGKHYLESIRDGRRVYVDGSTVPDVLADHRYSEAANSIAELYDLQHDAAKRDVLLYQDSETGNFHPRSFKSPKNLEDLTLRHQAFRLNMEPSFGMMGRAPDFLNAWLSGLHAGSSVFRRGNKGDFFAKNVSDFYRHVRDNNLTLTHVLVNPQPDRSKSVWTQSSEQDIALQITRENAEGYFVSGSRMVGTLALYAHEVLVMPSSVKPNTPSADKYCFGFALPLATKGLHLLSRSPLTPREPAASADFPLSSRYEENDAVLVFEDVFVPWERTFFYRDADMASRYGRATHCSAHAIHQVLVRSLVKAEFMVGLAQEVVKAVNGHLIPEVQQQLGDLYLSIEPLSAVIYKAEREFVRTDFSTVAPNSQVMSAGQISYYEKFSQMVDTLRSFAAGAMVATPSLRDLDGPISHLVRRHCQAANMPANEWIALMRLAIDIGMSGFGARQQIYEKYYQGPPHMVRAAYANNYARRGDLADKIRAAVTRFSAA